MTSVTSYSQDISMALARESADLDSLVRTPKDDGTGAPNRRRPERHQSRHAPALEQHFREMDPYRAFVNGQRDKRSGKVEGMTQYLADWDRKWAEISGVTDTEGSMLLTTLLPPVKDPWTDNKQRSRSFRSGKGRSENVAGWSISRRIFLHLVTAALGADIFLNMSSCLTAFSKSIFVAAAIDEPLRIICSIFFSVDWSMATFIVISPKVSVVVLL
ncbi:hypothetical protein MMC07_004644 [Pseudocyphellaria aurata]|nr:hypothetical protein [Pseudocyphellaria aurata]